MLDVRSPEFAENRDVMLDRLAEIDALLDRAEAGGGPEAHARLARRGKLPVRERIALALDPDSPFLEISSLAAYDSDYVIGGGAVCGIGVIAGVECVVFANDPSVLGGAITPYVDKKWMRALEIARDNRIPYVSFVESAGADLRMEGDAGSKDGKPARRPARTTHFAETGRFFYEMIELSKPPDNIAPTGTSARAWAVIESRTVSPTRSAVASRISSGVPSPSSAGSAAGQIRASRGSRAWCIRGLGPERSTSMRSPGRTVRTPAYMVRSSRVRRIVVR